MKRNLLSGLLVIILLFSITGCGIKENNSSNKEEEYNAEFTELVNDKFSHVSYKLPKGHQSNNAYSDGNTNVMFDIETSSNDVARFHEYDKYAEKVEKVEINGVTYEYYKANYLKDWIVYIFRTQKSKNDFYLFEFNAYNSNYDDNQIFKFMNTVVYEY